jgi:hypothetical protein
MSRDPRVWRERAAVARRRGEMTTAEVYERLARQCETKAKEMTP